MTKTFSELSEYGAFVAYFPDENVYVIWNGSATYNAFIGTDTSDWKSGWLNFECFTNYSAKTLAEAVQAAKDWYAYKKEDNA